MARHTFGMTTADWLVTNDPITGDADSVPGAVVQMWTALTGGTQITDLLNSASTPETTVTSDSNGFLPTFFGPDTSPDTMKMAADANGGAGPRYWIFANDVDGTINNLAATQAGNVTSLAALNANAPVFNYFNAGISAYPARPSTGAPVWWVGPNAPAFGGTGAVAGLDYWIGPSS